jgi:hypothetical protein
MVMVTKGQEIIERIRRHRVWWSHVVEAVVEMINAGCHLMMQPSNTHQRMIE